MFNQNKQIFACVKDQVSIVSMSFHNKYPIVLIKAYVIF